MIFHCPSAVEGNSESGGKCNSKTCKWVSTYEYLREVQAWMFETFFSLLIFGLFLSFFFGGGGGGVWVFWVCV